MESSMCVSSTRRLGALTTVGASAIAVAVAASTVAADPLRLRGDAYATAESPTGLLSLSGRDKMTPNIDAEAEVWMGASDGTNADVLIVVVQARDPKGRGSVRIGRQIVLAGALRPVHVDGLAARVRLPSEVDVDVFGGMPVVPQFGPRSWDWLAGGRVSRALGPGRIGIGYLEQRDHGELSTRELGADASYEITKQIDVTAATALDTISFGVAEARLSAMYSRKDLRLEVFGVDRSAAHLLPATSLFSVLGDLAAIRPGASARWRAAPRLDLTATTGVRIVDREVAEDLDAGTRLRLDDRGASSIGLELTRQGGTGSAWTGARTTGRFALCHAWAASLEAELVRPDDSHGRGTLWPWSLAAVTWRPTSEWDAAIAVEASASPEYRSRVDVLARLSRRWEGP
jgi:hypothetical protein